MIQSLLILIYFLPLFACQFTLNLISYNDVYELHQDMIHGEMRGGPSRVIPLVRKMRSENPNSLVLFAGDTISPSLFSAHFKGMQMAYVHNALTTDYACLGNHEFDLGIDVFLKFSAMAKFVWLNANCYEQSTKALLRETVPYAVREYKDLNNRVIRVGLFGVMYDMKDSSKGLYWMDPVQAGKDMVSILKGKEKVDLIIALTHQDFIDDDTFAQHVKGVDFIVGGHDHSAMMQSSFGATYIKADMNFRTVWKTQIDFTAGINSASPIVHMENTLSPILKNMATDPVLDQIIFSYTKKMERISSRVIGAVCTPLSAENKIVRSQDCVIGNVFADALQAAYMGMKIDVALMNGGGIRSDRIYPAGTLTFGDLVSLEPFSDSIVVVETDGHTLRSLIEQEMSASCGMENIIVQNGFYLHPAGLKYVFQCDKKDSGTLTLFEWAKHPTFSGSINADDKLNLALTDYMLKSKFEVLTNAMVVNIVKESDSKTLEAALESFIAALPNKTVCYETELRSSVTFTQAPKDQRI